MATQPDVLIIGAGLAGLACARHLQEAGVSCDILEAGDAVGGRVRTDEVEGFLLDRGFQVLLTAYPEAQRVLDFPALDLKPFTPGALVWSAGKLHRMVDPWRVPAHWAEAARLPIGKWKDKLRLLRLRRRLTRSSLEKIFGARERSTHEALLAEGFSAPFI
ncbi:MAG: FAD-dependent oxidoreductase, partial [Bryobacteraceae bacterium]